jgi:hypothetical protein
MCASWALAMLAGCNLFDRECENNDDCGEGYRCARTILGTSCKTACDCHVECRRREYCGEAGWASDGTMCLEGCRDDDACHEGQICSAGRCKIGCRDDGQCRTGTVCFASECVEGCRSDPECARGEICFDRRCIEGCRDDDACGVGEQCVYSSEGHGRCGAGCLDDEECDEPTRCVCGRCVERCDSVEDCALDEICPLAPDTCLEVRCTSEVPFECAGEPCRPLVVRVVMEGLEAYEPCCLEIADRGCGHSLLGSACGVIDDGRAPASCGCAPTECCLPGGRCGTLRAVALEGMPPLCVPYTSNGAPASCASSTASSPGLSRRLE